LSYLLVHLNALMHEITLICTYHAVEGRCNEAELYSILESIRPDVIFEETPPSYYDAYYVERSRFHNVEHAAISRYSDAYNVPHVPVDSDDVPDETFFLNHDRMTKRVRGGTDQNGFHYRELSKTSLLNIERGGFNYLNSQHYMNRNNELNAILEAALTTIGDHGFFETYRLWNEVNAKRETEMLRNIYEYSSQHRYNKAVFLIGAGHRKSIIQKVDSYAPSHVKLYWRYYPLV
jgi:hypothetical protein